jgi:3-deoxy-7-phosphoheptulonate synthase
MLQAYGQAAATLNLLRAFANRRLCQSASGPPVDARHIGAQPWADKFAEISDRIGEALDFMEACGVDPRTVPQLQGTSFYTSHEALLLPL